MGPFSLCKHPDRSTTPPARQPPFPAHGARPADLARAADLAQPAPEILAFIGSPLQLPFYYPLLLRSLAARGIVRFLTY